MAVLSLTNCAIYVAQADLSGKSNQVQLGTEAAPVDTTTFGSSGYRSAIGGLKTTTASVSGFFDATDGTYPDDRMFADLGTADVAHTFSPTGGADGDLAYFFKSMRQSYMWGGRIGDAVGFSGSAVGSSSPLVRGTILLPSSATRTTSSTGTINLLGAVSSTQRLYAAMHVFSIAGTATPTFTAIVQSAAAVGFSSPSTAASFSAATTVGSQFISAAGPITNTYYRISWTITGTNPIFSVAIAVGIGPL